MSEKLNVLVIGGGGREHALVWKLKQSPLARKIYCMPGNGGISQDAEIAALPAEFKAIKNFTDEKKIDLILVGPEVPLVKGMADYFRSEGVMIFGPAKKAAMLEGSKVFAKNFMKKYSIPTAPFEVFEDSKKAIEYLSSKSEAVIKADGLCAGKGVVVSSSFDESKEAIINFMDKKVFGEAGLRVVIEEKLKDEEVSVLVLISKNNYAFLIPSQDHKAAYDKDKGPNTGGMGAYAPASLIDEEILIKIKKNVERVIAGFESENIEYNGVLYIGLMIDKRDINVLEFNVRFGDPEAQVIFPMMENDLLEAVLMLQRGERLNLNWKKGCCVDVVLASGGYPGKYAAGKLINFEFDRLSDDVFLFHAGTELITGRFYTCGGRVLNVAATGDDIADAGDKVYNVISKIHFEGMHYRKDIGIKELNRGRS